MEYMDLIGIYAFNKDFDFLNCFCIFTGLFTFFLEKRNVTNTEQRLPDLGVAHGLPLASSHESTC